MKFLSLVLLYILWSCPHVAMAKAPPAFQTVAGSVDTPGSLIEIKNMPRIRSQDSFGVCAAFSSAAIAQKKACDNDKEEFPDCSQIPSTKEISPFSMTSWARTTRKNMSKEDYASHLNLQIGGELSGGQALYNSRKSFAFMPESCYPFDQVANKYGDNKALVDKLLKDLEQLYDKNKTEATATPPCETCLAAQINERLGTNTNKESIAEALTEKTFSEFLYRVVFNGCRRIPFNPKPDFEYFPKTDAKRENLVPKIKEVLASGNPIHLDGVCITRDPVTDSCTGNHSFVISGYKKVCASSSPKTCRDLVKVHNSWGEDWQKKYNDGWVDAASIVENISDLDKATLTWLI